MIIYYTIIIIVITIINYSSILYTTGVRFFSTRDMGARSQVGALVADLRRIDFVTRTSNEGSKDEKNCFIFFFCFTYNLQRIAHIHTPPYIDQQVCVRWFISRHPNNVYVTDVVVITGQRGHVFLFFFWRSCLQNLLLNWWLYDCKNNNTVWLYNNNIQFRFAGRLSAVSDDLLRRRRWRDDVPAILMYKPGNDRFHCSDPYKLWFYTSRFIVRSCTTNETFEIQPKQLQTGIPTISTPFSTPPPNFKGTRSIIIDLSVAGPVLNFFSGRGRDESTKQFTKQYLFINIYNIL